MVSQKINFAPHWSLKFKISFHVIIFQCFKPIIIFSLCKKFEINEWNQNLKQMSRIKLKDWTKICHKNLQQGNNKNCSQ